MAVSKRYKLAHFFLINFLLEYGELNLRYFSIDLKSKTC